MLPFRNLASKNITPASKVSDPATFLEEKKPTFAAAMGQSEFVHLPDVKVRRENGAGTLCVFKFSFDVYIWSTLSLISSGLRLNSNFLFLICC